MTELLGYDEMQSLPDYDGSAEMREAIRTAAQRLHELDIAAPFRQAAEITSYIERERVNGKFRISGITHQRWAAFVSGKTKKGHDPEVLKAAWYWLNEVHYRYLSEAYVQRTQSTLPIIDREVTLDLQSLWSHYRSDYDDELKSTDNIFGYHVISMPYIYDRAKIAFGSILAHGNEFKLRLPFISRAGKVICEKTFGNFVITRRGTVFFGVGFERDATCVLFVNHNFMVPNSRNMPVAGKLIISDAEVGVLEAPCALEKIAEQCEVSIVDRDAVTKNPHFSRVVRIIGI